MKKFALIACAIATSAIAFAIPTHRKAEKVAPATPNIHFVEQMEARPNSMMSLSAELLYSDTTYGAYGIANLPEFHSGTPSSGIGYVTEAAIIVPYLPKTPYVVYANAYVPNASWYIDSKLVAKDTAYYMEKNVEIGQTYPVPTIKTDKFVSGDTAEIIFNDYQFGALYTSYYAQYGFENYLSIAPDWGSMTQCAMYTEDPGDDQYPSYGCDWTFVGAGDNGKYAYGTKLMPDTKVAGQYFDTIFAVIKNKDVMYINNISVGVWTQGTAVLGTGDALKLGIYSVSDSGLIDFTTPLYTASATIDDYSDYDGGSTKWYGTLDFKFYDEDQWGSKVQVPAIVEGNFVVAFLDINSGTADFGFIQDYYTPFTGNTWLIKNGKMTQMWRSPSSLLINFYGVLPVALMPDTISAAAEAQSVTLNITTNVWDEEWYIDELPEWLSIDLQGEYDTIASEEYEEGYYVEYKYNTELTATFEATTEYREAEVTFELLGREYKVLFCQSDKPSGLKELKYINDGKRYDVLGKEVDENYKGVVIMNGKKMLQ